MNDISRYTPNGSLTKPGPTPPENLHPHEIELHQSWSMAAPKEIPPELLSAYTMNGQVPVGDWYVDQAAGCTNGITFSRAEIDELLTKAERRENNYYGDTDTYLFAAIDAYPIRGKSCVIAGTQVPWYESVCLTNGASSVTTIEYAPITFNHPALEALTPAEFDRAPRTFDCALSISSFEHDGLGRYGDPLAPDADLQAMKKMKQIVKPGGILFLAVPIGKDKLVWNAHRIYGRLRLGKLMEGWRVVAAAGFNEAVLDHDTGTNAIYQPVFVLENTDPS